MPDRQPIRRRIGEHVQQIELRPVAEADTADKGPDRVRGLKGALGLPAILPSTLQLGSQHRGVAVRRHAASVRGYHPVNLPVDPRSLVPVRPAIPDDPVPPPDPRPSRESSAASGSACGIEGVAR